METLCSTSISMNFGWNTNMDYQMLVAKQSLDFIWEVLFIFNSQLQSFNKTENSTKWYSPLVLFCWCLWRFFTQHRKPSVNVTMTFIYQSLNQITSSVYKIISFANIQIQDCFTIYMNSVHFLELWLVFCYDIHFFCVNCVGYLVGRSYWLYDFLDIRLQ